jgi:hypothetical protein
MVSSAAFWYFLSLDDEVFAYRSMYQGWMDLVPNR